MFQGLSEGLGAQIRDFEGSVETNLNGSATKQGAAARELREEMTGSFQKLGTNVSVTLKELGDYQKERLDNVTAAIRALTDKNGHAQDALKLAVEDKLEAIRAENHRSSTKSAKR